jgi:type I restriction enzyme R subunit
VGVVEAKKLGATLGGVEAQTLAYASETLPGLVVPIRPLPFRYESTGAETYFTNGLEPDAAARRVFCFHQPATLRQWVGTRQTLKGRMREAQALNRGRLRGERCHHLAADSKGSRYYTTESAAVGGGSGEW